VSSSRVVSTPRDLPGGAGPRARGAADLKAWCQAQLAKRETYVVEHLEDMPEVRDWMLGDWAQQG
jgi:xylulose-5-phosphate/fructose-6-phosphate phosphoketolase